MFTENSLLTQSRFILMDSILLFMINFGLFAILKFRKKQPFTIAWFSWLFTSTTFLTFGLCVKFIGLSSLIIAFFIVFYDFWHLLPNKKIKSVNMQLILTIHSFQLIIWLIAADFMVTKFYIHFFIHNLAIVNLYSKFLHSSNHFN